MRMAEVERALAGVNGLRVHRSWWVARRAVKNTQATGGSTSWSELQLVTGQTVPVARSKRKKLKTFLIP